MLRKLKQKLFKDKGKSSASVVIEEGKRIGTLELYITLLKYRITRGNLEKEIPLATNEVRYGVSTTYTSSKYSKTIFIQEMPEWVEKDFKSELRERVYDYKNTSLSFITHMEPFNLRDNKRLIKHRLGIWASRYDEYMRRLDGMTEGERAKEESRLESSEMSDMRMVNSYRYLNDAIDNKREFMRARMEIKIQSSDKDELIRAVNEIESYLYLSDIKTYEVLGYVKEYNRTFGAGSISTEESIVHDITNNFIFDDRIIGNLTTYSQGYIPDDGQYIGNDYFTGIPTFRELDRGTDKCNYMVIGDSGSGKSTFIKNLVTFALLHKRKVILTDYEGDEYRELGKFFGATTVGFTEGTYFDTMEIGDLTGDKDVDPDLKNNSINLTLKVMGLLVRPEGLDNEERAVFNDVVSSVYLSNGVTDDPKTWGKSKGIKYHDIYFKLLEKSKNLEFYNEYKVSINRLLNAWRVYFEEDGLFSSKFRYPVSVNSLKSADFILFLFGERGGSNAMISELDIQLKQLYVAAISNILTNQWYFIDNKLIYKIYEEGQRYLEVTGSSEIVANDFTGGRKRGLINVLVHNAPLAIFNSKDGFCSGITSNLTGGFLSKLGDPTSISQIAAKFNLANSEELLRMITLSEEPELKHHFVGTIIGEYTTLTKVSYPSWLIKTSLYSTRIREIDEGVDDKKEKEMGEDVNEHKLPI